MSTSIGRVHLAGAFGAIYLLWGGTYLAIALGLQSIPPFLLIGARSILGGAVLLALSGLRPLLRSWEDWRHATISGALLFPRMSRDARICAAVCSVGVIGHHFGDHSFLDCARQRINWSKRTLEKVLDTRTGFGRRRGNRLERNFERAAFAARWYVCVARGVVPVGTRQRICAKARGSYPAP
jgi:hypothetical protein